MKDCIFCKIIAGDIPSHKVYEDERVIAFYDVAPMAKTHVLIAPKAHVENLLDARALPDDVLAHLLRTAANVAQQLGLSESGFRMVSNCGEGAGQSVMHLHLHILGGQKLPPRLA